MRWLLILTVCVFVSESAIKRPKYDLNKAQQYFEQFIEKYNKTYTYYVQIKRLEIFTENLKIINRLNSYNKGVHAIAMFADLTPTEFVEQTRCLAPDDDESEEDIDEEDEVTSEVLRSPGKKRRKHLCAKVKSVSSVSVPETLDYRDHNAVSPVRNQLSCNSCWAFTSAGCLEGAYAIKHGVLYSLSAQQLMDCLPRSGHCHEHGSSMRVAFSDLKDKSGVLSSEEYPYIGENEHCQYDAAKVKVNVTGCTNFKLEDENDLKAALNEYGPIGVGMSVEGIQHYESGIVGLEECPPDKATHAVLLVGYGSEDRSYWIMKNSWGTEWGEGGYLRLERGANVCGFVNKHMAVAAVE